MQDTRNTPFSPNGEGRGAVCVNTERVMDACRDRDCFENTRVYLSGRGQELLAAATNVRIREANVLWAYVGLDEVPFNRGFYQVTVRYYIDVECEACLGLGRSQIFHGISVLEKEVILYGGEGNVVAYSSNPNDGYCSRPNPENVSSKDPIAVVETVKPVVLGSKIVECGCPFAPGENCEFPENVKKLAEGELILLPDGPRLTVSFGIFSVIRIHRPAQIVVQGYDYSVPEKECVAAQNDDDPCHLFHSMPFPEQEFKVGATTDDRPPRGICGCQGKPAN